MTHPADTDPFLAMAAAAQHVLGGVREVELEWWTDSENDDGPDRRFTINMRGVDRWSAAAHEAMSIRHQAEQIGQAFPDTVPDDL
jgi:hypothetical protein